jgi:hypothetical protein
VSSAAATTIRPMRKGYEGRAHRDCQSQSCQFTVHSSQSESGTGIGFLWILGRRRTEDREEIVSNPRGPFCPLSFVFDLLPFVTRRQPNDLVLQRDQFGSGDDEVVAGADREIGAVVGPDTDGPCDRFVCHVIDRYLRKVPARVDGEFGETA